VAAGLNLLLQALADKERNENDDGQRNAQKKQKQ
jgi:hypothetical protein